MTIIKTGFKNIFIFKDPGKHPKAEDRGEFNLEKNHNC